MSLQLRQSHGWLNGTLAAETLDHVRREYEPRNKSTWPCIIPDSEYLFVDRHGAALHNPQLRVKMEDVREADATQQPELTVIFIRWGGVHRIGDEQSSTETDDAAAPWGVYGAPPSDWYMDAVVARGLTEQPSRLAAGAAWPP